MSEKRRGAIKFNTPANVTGQYKQVAVLQSFWRAAVSHSGETAESLTAGKPDLVNHPFTGVVFLFFT